MSSAGVLVAHSAVFALIERAVDSEDASHFAEVWHAILRNAHACPVRPVIGGHTFEVGLRNDTQRCWHELKILFHGGAYGEPRATVMLIEED